MLAKDPELDGVPFLFMSDHDPHAFEIFSTCKYGSRKNAFVTKSTICPKLQWAGATIEFYERMAKSWPAIETERRIRENVIPESDRERVQNELAIEVTSKMLSRLERGRGVLNKADTMRIKHFFNYEVFSDQHDPLLYADLQAMGMNPLGSQEPISSTAAGKVRDHASQHDLD